MQSPAIARSQGRSLTCGRLRLDKLRTNGFGVSVLPDDVPKATKATCPTSGVAHRNPRNSAARGVESDTSSVPAKMKSSAPIATENIVRFRLWQSRFIAQVKTDLRDVGKFCRRFPPSGTTGIGVRCRQSAIFETQAAMRASQTVSKPFDFATGATYSQSAVFERCNLSLWLIFKGLRDGP